MSTALKCPSCGHEKRFEQRAVDEGLPCPACGSPSLAAADREEDVLWAVAADDGPAVAKPRRPAPPPSDAGNGQPGTAAVAPPDASAQLLRWVALAIGFACLFSLSAGAGLWFAWGGGANPGTGAAAERWTVLFRADDPALWNTDSPGEKFAVPLRRAPATFRYLRLRRLDTGEALILPLTRAQLDNGKPPTPDVGFWWNGTAKEDWEGRHLGIAEAPRHKFPAPKGKIGVMTEGWDVFFGSGFGHKCFVNDGQYYCWRGKEIRRTVFEIAVTDGPLTPDEKRDLLTQP